MPHITIDSRESRSPVFAELHRVPGITVDVKELPCGDYLPHEQYGVERKDAADFVASIMDRRLFAQVRRMKDEYERQCFIIEGNPYATRSAITPEAIRGAVSYLMAIEGVSVVTVPNAAETALLLVTLARHLQEGLGYEVALRANKPKDLADLTQYLVEGLPGIGPTGAKALVARFGSAHAVFNASVLDLCSTPGIGKKTAERIHFALRSAGPIAPTASPEELSLAKGMPAAAQEPPGPNVK